MPKPPQHTQSTPQMPSLMPLPAAPNNHEYELKSEQLIPPPVMQSHGQSPGGLMRGSVDKFNTDDLPNEEEEKQEYYDDEYEYYDEEDEYYEDVSKCLLATNFLYKPIKSEEVLKHCKAAID